MPRKAREVQDGAVYHVMSRSISETNLFRCNADKEYYLNLLKKYSEKCLCSIYAYCLMDNHVHLHFDPKGHKMSKFMLKLNTAYVRYYNNKYKRHGCLFQGRYESRILDSNEYNLTVSAYIHNNPHDIEGYTGKEEEYKYSSYGIYLGLRKDAHELIDKTFIMELFNIHDEQRFIDSYKSFVSHQRDIGSFKNLKVKLSSAIEYEYFSGRKIILRDYTASKVISFISQKLMIPENAGLITKGSRKVLNFRAFTSYVLKVLCGFSYKEICNSFYNITVSGCARLCDKGFELSKKGTYSSMFNELISYKV